MESSYKLSKIRAMLTEHSLDAYLVFHNDAHNSEYLAKCDERVHFISGFSGSAGLCVITATEALLWTDGRYYLQAEKQLDEGWKLIKMEPGFPTYFEWLLSTLTSGQTIGVDPLQISAAAFKLRSTYFGDKGITLKAVEQNLVDSVWGSDKPPMPVEDVFVHDLKYAGLTVLEKYNLVAERLKVKKLEVDHLLVTTLDDIDWLVNLRGKDIKFNPVFFAYALFSPVDKRVMLFIEEGKTRSVLPHLSINSIEGHPYENIGIVLTTLAKEGKKIGYDENTCNAALFQAFKETAVATGENIIQAIKAVKNPVEMDGMRRVNIRNCASLVQYFAWMKNHLS